MNIKDFFRIAKAVKTANDIGKDAWRAEMYEKRWKNFFTVWLYLLICVFFLFLGYILKDSFFTIFHWYIWMGLSYIFLALGIYTMFSYLWIIIKGKK